jgi:hypothetical protein
MFGLKDMVRARRNWMKMHRWINEDLLKRRSKKSGIEF